MEINEIKKIVILGRKIELSQNHIVDVYGLKSKSVTLTLKEDNISLDIPYIKGAVQVCSEDDLNRLLTDLEIFDVDISLFRLKVIETKKWGKKPIYNEGADSICFCCHSKRIGDNMFIIFYNTSGTKEVEYLYIHGVWKIEIRDQQADIDRFNWMS